MRLSKSGMSVLMRSGSFVDTNLSFYITKKPEVSQR